MSNDSTGSRPGTPPPAGGPHTGPARGPHGDGFFGAMRRIGITRGQDRWVGGVASGLADRFGLDPLLARGLVGLSILMGVGLVLYGVAWALLPEPDGRIHLEQAVHGDWDGGLIGAGVLVLIGATNGGWWFSWGPFDSGWFAAVAWSAALAAVIIIAATARRDRRDPGSEHRPSTPDAGSPAGQPWSGSPVSPPAAPAPSSAPYPAPAPSPASAPYATTAPYATSAPYATTAPVTGTPAPSVAGAGAPPTAPGPVPPSGTAGTGTYPGTQAGAAPAWQHPGAGGPAQPGYGPKPPKPPRAPRPRVPGPGPAVTGTVLGLILIGLAVLLVADRTGAYNGPVASVVVGAGVVLVGLAIILCGILGRRAGGLTALAVLGLIAAGPAIAADSDLSWNADGRTTVFGNQSYGPTTRSAAADGYSLGIGSSVVDLRDVPLIDDETLVVPIAAGVGNVSVLVPEDIALVTTVRSGGGTVTWDVDGAQQTISGMAHDRTYASEEMADATTAQLELRVDLGLGDVSIEEAR